MSGYDSQFAFFIRTGQEAVTSWASHLIDLEVDDAQKIQ
jgi:hypothetical protein